MGRLITAAPHRRRLLLLSLSRQTYHRLISHIQLEEAGGLPPLVLHGSTKLLVVKGNPAALLRPLVQKVPQIDPGPHQQICLLVLVAHLSPTGVDVPIAPPVSSEVVSTAKAATTVRQQSELKNTTMPWQDDRGQ